MGLSIPEQLVNMYHKETWHKVKMTDEEALEYHKKKYESGDIVVYVESGVVLGYYERYFVGDTCFLWNVYIDDSYRGGKVFCWLCKKFFSSLPKGTKYIVGEKQKIGGKIQEVKIRR